VTALGELSTRFPGVTSVQCSVDDELVVEWYDGLDGAAQPRNTRSVTKTVTGMLVGIAIAEGVIDGVTDAVDRYLPDDAAEAARGVTLEQLLTMTSCLDCDDGDEASPGNEERLYPEADWVGFARRIPLRSPCGPRLFRYCTAHSVLLGAALEAATGEELSVYARRVLFEPLSIDEPTWFRSATGFAFPGGGLELRTGELRRLGQLYLDGGAFEGHQVVPAAWVAASVTPHVSAHAGLSYGYLWWLRSYGLAGRVTDSWQMLGNGGNKVVVLPDLGAVVVVTATNFGQRGMHELTERLVVDELVPIARSAR
jgi:CubicO group peptidase (beta-lactamase class C family)